MESEIIVYGDIKWRRYPESKRRSDRLYYRPTSHNIEKGWERYLHRQVWRDANGTIPDGQDIHHADGDTLNNDISNLQCLTRKLHFRHHADTATDEQREASRRLLERLRPLASAWHRSAEGREWHRALGKAAWAERSSAAYVCEHCGATYQTTAIHGNNRFCSGACRTASRVASGKDNERRACTGCGVSFTVNRYQAQRFCSRQCATIHRKPRGPNKKR